VRRGLWRELADAAVSVDPYRRNLQRAYLQLFDERLNGRAAVGGDVRAFFRGELQSLGTQLAAGQAKVKAGDAATRMHLADARRQVQRILDPKFAPVEAGSAIPGQGGRPGLDEELAAWLLQGLSCWPEFK
jgi:hypothetical protein